METFTKQSSVKLLDSEICIDNKVVIYKSRSKAILFILVSLLLAIAGKLFLHHPDYYVVGWSFIILSVLCLIFDNGIKAIFIRIGFYEVSAIKLTGFIKKMIRANAEKREELLNEKHL